MDLKDNCKNTPSCLEPRDQGEISGEQKYQHGWLLDSQTTILHLAWSQIQEYRDDDWDTPLISITNLSMERQLQHVLSPQI